MGNINSMDQLNQRFFDARISPKVVVGKRIYRAHRKNFPIRKVLPNFS
jgi:hypothetical protein